MAMFVAAVFVFVISVVAPSTGSAGAPKCRADDPLAAGDAAAVAAVRGEIDAACPCAGFAAVEGKNAHGKYVACAKGIVNAAVQAEQLRAKCKKLALYHALFSTCGYPDEPARTPCLRSTAKGPVCKIKTCQKQDDLACAGYENCLDAADTNHDGEVSALDNGACHALDCGAVLLLPQSFVEGRLLSCLDSCTNPLTREECLSGCGVGASAMGEVTALLMSICEADTTVNCEELLAALEATCATAPVPQECEANCTDPICEEKCVLVASCTAIAEQAYQTCLN